MSSSTKDIRKELQILSENYVGENRSLDEIIHLFCIYRPKANPDNYFRERLRQKLIDIGEEEFLRKNARSEKIKSRMQFIYSGWLPSYTTSFSCLFLVIVLLKVFYLNNVQIPLESKNTSVVETYPNSVNQIQETVLPKSSTTNLNKEDTSAIESEISGIIDDMNIVIGDSHSSSKQGTQKEKSSISQNPYSLDIGVTPINPVSLPQTASLLRSNADLSLPMSDESNNTYSIPKFPDKVNIYKKIGPDFTQVELISHTGFGVVSIELDTEKNINRIQSKIDTLRGTSNIASGGKISYIPMKKIGKVSPNTHYLIPVISYTLESGKNIFIPIVRGFE